MANKVPDNFEFSLQDVVDVVQPSVHSLQGCFDAATNACFEWFDENWLDDRTRLREFRNYGRHTSLIKYGRLYMFSIAQSASLEMPIPYSPMLVASDDDWKVLESYLGMSQEDLDKERQFFQPAQFRNSGNVGKKLRIGDVPGHLFWTTLPGAVIGTDEVGFSALPGGMRDATGGYLDIRDRAYFWTSTEYGEQSAYARVFQWDQVGIDRVIYPQRALGEYTFRIRFSLKFVRAAFPCEQTFPDGTIVDQVTDGVHYYDCVKIGTQVWTKQNYASPYWANSIYNNSYTNGFFSNESDSIW